MFLQKNLIFLKKDNTYKQFAQSLNIPLRTLEDIMYKDNCNPRLNTLIAISTALSVGLDDLIFKDLSK